MTTPAAAIRHLWTHKTQDHPWLSDRELVIDRAEGVWVWMEDGTKLMDGFAGLAVVNVGHGRREIAEAIAEQTVRLAYYPTTRQFSNRPAAELVERRARELRDAIVKEGADTVSAVIMEPVLSSGGFIIPPLGWLRAVREICDELGVLMIADEVITGFGRTGKWFGVDHEGVVPDLMTVAKGITSGYLPLSGTIARGRLADAFPETSTQEVVHPNTYAAHPVACAAALANLQIMEKDRLVDNAAVMGQRLVDGLRHAVAGKRIVGEVRGRGLLVCAELVAPDGSGQPLPAAEVAKLDRKAWERGAIVYARGQVVRLAPPL